MRTWVPIVALAVAVAALGAWVYYKPAPATNESHALSALKRENVTRIRLERPSTAPGSENVVVVERTGEAWKIVQPFTARADAVQVERLLAILDARSAVRFPAKELERYGIEGTQVKLTLNDQSFTYG